MTFDPERCETVYDAVAASAEAAPDNAFLCVPPQEGRDYHAEGWEITYADALEEVDRLAGLYDAAGYGVGHRIALHLENRAEHLLHFLALNKVGAGCVPVNPVYTHDEMLYQMEHSDAVLAVCLPGRVAEMEKVAEDRPGPPLKVVNWEKLDVLPPPEAPRRNARPERSTEVCLFYTSGTTGRPKGCIVTNHYYITTGQAYLDALGHLGLAPGETRCFNPLPLYHVNHAVISFMGMVLSQNCQIVPDRFHPSSWWQEIKASGATIFHYLGVVPPMLLNMPPGDADRDHDVKFGLGAGIEPDLHARFEERFGMPLIEGWGMTETGRIFAAAHEPRHIDTRAFGRPNNWMTGKVVDENDEEVPRGTEGELVVRSTAEDPRDGFFSGYLKNEEATEESWRGGWFHTGDTVLQREDDMFVFVDRKKNIIRRSGENIAAAEVEACIAADEKVAQVAVIAAPDEIREEEVMACVVPMSGVAGDRKLAEDLMARCQEKLSYYKAPGWWLFVDSLPTTGTQKVQKTQIFPPGADPREEKGVLDFRDRKKRRKA
jgi:crotonobetaine/carnitine-CoA ligase